MSGANRAPGLADWRDDRVYERLSGIDRAGLMWEWLRRDPGYVEWHARASRVTGGARSVPRGWGLHFRRRSGPRCAFGPDHLACRSRSVRDSGRGPACRSRSSRQSLPRHGRALAFLRSGQRRA
ncbi:transcriptional regulator domain-containing protein [Novosphingobium endophyticum]|uniref:transcriptional regulator domain-containing protein n=1 Tax=Novosphingobium endophyticum TaxID=1955250 RepID=UPI00357148F2